MDGVFRSEAKAMTTPQWTVIAFAAWTLLILLFGIGMRRLHLIFSGEAAFTSFPGDTVHGGTAYRRAVRAHANCVENLPVYAAIVLVAETARLQPSHMDVLALCFIICRIVQSSIHILLPETNSTVAIRFTFFSVQVVAMIWMMTSMASLGLH